MYSETHSHSYSSGGRRGPAGWLIARYAVGARPEARPVIARHRCREHISSSLVRVCLRSEQPQRRFRHLPRRTHRRVSIGRGHQREETAYTRDPGTR